ncbi:MAG: hypothetical protein GVY26_10005 [Bacteroidetes bacterium]|jgi:hypothetical protein|nr:hypothetical protein [Bacteroidota bacterium]
MKDRDDIQQELEELAPDLARLRQSVPRELAPPPGYFDSLADRVLEQAMAEDKPPLNVVWHRRRSVRQWKTWLAVAAAALLVLSVSLYVFYPPAHSEESLAGLSDAEARAYIEGNIDEFSISLMLEAELVQTGDPALPAGIIPDLEEEEVEEYLYEILEDEELEELF